MRKKLLSLLVLLMVAVTGAVAQTTYKVSVKEGTDDATNWTITPAEATTTGVAQGTEVTVTYSGTKKVKSVKAVKKAPAVPSYDNTLNINTYDPELNNWENVTVPTGKHWLITGTGEATTNTIIIANNATVTLSGVNITAWERSITCEGNATIILADGTTNNLYAADEYGGAGIEMRGGSGTSLTIQGNTGVLNITSGNGPAIGAGYGYAGCAINIEGGIINATSTDGPGIGAAYNTACGNITISGGTVAATGGYGCPGIGGASSANCGDITITSNVTSVTATKGSEAPYSIGASSSGSCGTVTIGGVVGAITESPFTYPASAEPAEPTTVTWTTAEMNSNFYAYNGWEYNNSHYGITVTASGSDGDGWSQDCINVNEEPMTFTFTSTVGNIKSIVITADNINIDKRHVPAGWTANNMWDNPRTLSWNGTASTSVNLTLSEGQNFSGISTIVFTLEGAAAPAAAEGHPLSASEVGEIVCSDGLAYAAADKDNLPTGVTAVAIVAYLGDGDTSDNTYNNGLAIAMSNANDGSGCGWGDYFVSYNCVSKSNDIATAIGFKDGISSTNTLTSDGHYHEAATAAASNNGTAAPTGTSGWFLPSMGQWNLIVQGLASKKAGSAVTTDISTSGNDTYTASNLNSVITDAGGTGFNGGYQSSTQYDSDDCWHMDISSGRASNYVFYAGDYVRSVLAF